MKTNQIICGDNVAELRGFPAECIDLVVTSPPYDNLRTYGKHTWDFEGVARELTRVLKPGGVIVWVVADATINGSETLTSMRQAIHFKDVCGLNVHDTMLYGKTNPIPLTHNRYEQAFEYAFVLSKGRPSRWNAIKVPTAGAGKKTKRYTEQEKGASFRARNEITTCAETKQKGNAWFYPTREGNSGEHPAPFPESLARDHIISWSNEGDTVLDPFAGSGTTLKAANDLNRRWIGIEVNPPYVEICNRRLGVGTWTDDPLFQ